MNEQARVKAMSNHAGHNWWECEECHTAEYPTIGGRMNEYRTEEPMTLLAVVEDDRGRQWYRWAAGKMHTACPWALLGAVHGDTVSNPDYECHRWEDLPPVRLISSGVSRDPYLADLITSVSRRTASATGLATPGDSGVTRKR